MNFDPNQFYKHVDYLGEKVPGNCPRCGRVLKSPGGINRITKPKLKCRCEIHGNPNSSNDLSRGGFWKN